ncbi:hypothetical protein V6N11_049715 [Hibiscus sabdariffa]|uniref:Uncharacterized protein n=2 Tax=Hibiscus sabdariffa TaxID=183260 RepID=A0ABR2B301_9ROSI
MAFNASRLNPIYDLDNTGDSEHGNVANSQHPHSQIQPHMGSIQPKTKPRGKGKFLALTKITSDVDVRKPLTNPMSDFPVLSRHHSKANSSRSGLVPHSSIFLDSSKHTIVVVDENLDLDVLMLPVEHNDNLFDVQNPSIGNPFDLPIASEPLPIQSRYLHYNH